MGGITGDMSLRKQLHKVAFFRATLVLLLNGGKNISPLAMSLLITLPCSITKTTWCGTLTKIPSFQLPTPFSQPRPLHQPKSAPSRSRTPAGTSPASTPRTLGAPPVPAPKGKGKGKLSCRDAAAQQHKGQEKGKNKGKDKSRGGAPLVNPLRHPPSQRPIPHKEELCPAIKDRHCSLSHTIVPHSPTTLSGSSLVQP